MAEDAYTVLGVSRTATEKEILRAYRRAAKRTHPDAGGSDAAFRRVQAAFELLSDPLRRRDLDDFLTGATTAHVPPTWAPNTPAGAPAGGVATAGPVHGPVRLPRRAKRIAAGVVAYLVVSAVGGSLAPGAIHEVIGLALNGGLLGLLAWGLWRVPAVRDYVRGVLHRPR